MLSIIICSCSTERLAAIKANIHNTIDSTPYEVIGIDNSEQENPIAHVYNMGTRQARGEYLLFVHEDIVFHSPNWDEIILHKLQDPTCGVIGFAGSKMRLPVTGGWDQSDESRVCNYYQTDYKKWINVHCNHDFEEVITLDGMALFCRKEVWEKHPFDEAALTSFHAYDIDFSLQLAHAGYKNYVCATDKVKVEHLSSGNFSTDWLRSSIHIEKNKWSKLPSLCTTDYSAFLNKHYHAQMDSAYKSFYGHLCRMGIQDLKQLPDTAEPKKDDLFREVKENADYRHIKSLLKQKAWDTETQRLFWKFMREAHTCKKYKLLYKYLWYRLFI